MQGEIKFLSYFTLFISYVGLLLPLYILLYNKGFKSINRYLAGFLFFSSLYLLESFTFFFSKSQNWVAFFTNTHSLFYLIGPFSFFYIRGILRDQNHLDVKDWLHFLPFFLFLIGSIPYLFSSWDYKLLVANNIQSEDWNIDQFHLNIIIPHKVDQALNVIQIYFYAASLWYLIWKYKRSSTSRIYNVRQYKLIRNWVFIFTLIVSIIAINFTITMANLWIYTDKSIFIENASFALLFASFIYVDLNIAVMIYPNIMYGLPTEESESIFVGDLQKSATITNSKIPLQNTEENLLLEAEIYDTIEGSILFSLDYINKIELALDKIISNEYYIIPCFKLSNLAAKSRLPEHHLTYYFNTVLSLHFSEWINKLRVEYIIKLLNKGQLFELPLEAISIKAGFTSQNTFIRSFKFHTGKTPNEYLKAIS